MGIPRYDLDMAFLGIPAVPASIRTPRGSTYSGRGLFRASLQSPSVSKETRASSTDRSPSELLASNDPKPRFTYLAQWTSKSMEELATDSTAPDRFRIPILAYQLQARKVRRSPRIGTISMPAIAQIALAISGRH